MRIGGLLKTSLIDYPGKIVAVIFTQGCNFRCLYCHNPELVYPDKFKELIPEKEVLSFLEKRKGLLEGVSISGGEPLLQPDIESFTEKIAQMGFLVKIDTNGSFPNRLRKLINSGHIHYVAMDIKAPENQYTEIAGVKVDFWKIRESIRIIMDSGVDYEFRTTYVTQLCKQKAVLALKRLVKGAKRYYIQRSNYPVLCNYNPDRFIQIRETMKEEVRFCEIR